MTFEIVSKPHVEAEYCDQWETTMIITLEREDGVSGDVWIVAGVPDYQRGSSEASGHQWGFEDAWVFGDHIDMWCSEPLKISDADGTYSDLHEAVLGAVRKVAIATHRQAQVETVTIADEDWTPAE